MRFILALILVVLAAVMQATFAPQVRVLGGEPDLVFLIVLAWSLRGPIEESAALAFVGGLCLDLLSAVPLGVTSAALLVVVWGLQVVRRQLFGVGVLLVFLFAVGGLLLVKSAEFIGLLFIDLAPPVFESVGYVILPSLVYNVVLLIPAYIGVRLLQGRVTTDEG